MAAITGSLTSHLLTLDTPSFKKATQTAFLEQAGKGTLEKNVLEGWVSQDRLYAQAYVGFASRLLAGLAANLPPNVNPTHLNERILDLVLDAINNVRRELKFFADVAGQYGLRIDAEDKAGGEVVSEGVKGYRGLFERVGVKAMSGEKSDILDALVLLWGTEICYLEAWRYAKSFWGEGEDGREEGKGGGDRDGGALRREFIPNWTSDEFAEFVGRIGGVVDEVWGEVNGGSENGDGEKEVLKRVEGIWRQVLDVEQKFWPVVEE